MILTIFLSLSVVAYVSEQKAGPLIEAWAQAIDADEGANTTVVVAAAAGTKRAAVSILTLIHLPTEYPTDMHIVLNVCFAAVGDLFAMADRERRRSGDPEQVRVRVDGEGVSSSCSLRLLHALTPTP